MSVCGHNASTLKDLPLLTAKDVEETADTGVSFNGQSRLSPGGESSRRRHYVHVRFVGNAYPHKAQLKIAWSELNHLPRHADGTLLTARRTASANGKNDDECAFRCPDDESLCLPARSVCNGVVNCPGGARNDESPATCDQWNELRRSAAAASGSAVPGDYGPSAIVLFVAVTVAIMVFGIVLFAANAYCHRRRSRRTTSGRNTVAANKSLGGIYSTVNYTIVKRYLHYKLNEINKQI